LEANHIKLGKGKALGKSAVGQVFFIVKIPFPVWLYMRRFNLLMIAVPASPSKPAVYNLKYNIKPGNVTLFQMAGFPCRRFFLSIKVRQFP